MYLKLTAIVLISLLVSGCSHKEVTPEEMTSESFVARRLQTHFGIRRDYIPLLIKASQVIKEIQKLL